MAKNLKVTLVRSGINRQERQKATIVRLGLRKVHASNVVPDNEAVRGMIRSVSHLVKVEPAE
ncbi:MAG: 50S ribosomal protein L30 [Deltaproteobacteria bacterium]|nr:50S ribosomal protein L30 [Deltaproteobacteria bacterium]